MIRKVSEITGVNMSILPKRTQCSILLYGRSDLSDEKNYQILIVVTDFTVGSKRFDTV